MVKSRQVENDNGIATWTIECSGKRIYTLIVGKNGETRVIQKSR